MVRRIVIDANLGGVVVKRLETIVGQEAVQRELLRQITRAAAIVKRFHNR